MSDPRMTQREAYEINKVSRMSFVFCSRLKQA